MLFQRLQNKRGSALLVTYLLTATLLVLGAAFLLMSSTDAQRATIQHKTEQAFYIAEAGLEQVLYELKEEFETGDQSWLDDVTIDGVDYGPNTAAFYTVYSQEVYPSGAYTHAFSPTNNNDYTVALRNVAGEQDLWIRSTGQVDGITQTVQVYAKIVNVSPWNNAIFGGSGGTGTMVNGNVNIYGSVHILGNGLAAGDDAINLGGTAELVGNNYNIGPQGMAQDLKDRIPDLVTTVFNGETVDTLNAELRVKKGVVSLSGNSAVGQADVTGNSVKETIDGAYVSDGYGGSKGITNVHSDNGTNEAYDLGDAVDFPSLSDAHPIDPSGNYYDYFNNNGLVLTNELASITPASSFTLGNCATNCITMDGSGNMAVKGIIYVSGSNNLGISGGDITYTGAGTILVTGSASIDATLVTPVKTDGLGDPIATYPYDASISQQNIVAIMTPNDIDIGGTSQEDIMGLFYAENEISTDMQTDLLGTIITNNFDITNQVPSIFQVPEVLNHLPPGIIADDVVWYANIVSWQKCDSQTAICGGV